MLIIIIFLNRLSGGNWKKYLEIITLFSAKNPKILTVIYSNKTREVAREKIKKI